MLYNLQQEIFGISQASKGLVRFCAMATGTSVLTFGTPSVDTHGMFKNSPINLTIPKNGTYLFNYAGTSQFGGAGNTQSRIAINGVSVGLNATVDVPAGIGSNSSSAVWMANCNSGDTISIICTTAGTFNSQSIVLTIMEIPPAI